MRMYATRNTVAAALVFFVFSGIAGIGNANLSQIDIASVRVNYADLNLNEAEEAATLYGRLRRAARQLCDDLTRKSLNDMVAAKECREFALDRAVRQVGNRQLNTIHQG